MTKREKLIKVIQVYQLLMHRVNPADVVIEESFLERLETMNLPAIDACETIVDIHMVALDLVKEIQAEESNRYLN